MNEDLTKEQKVINEFAHLCNSFSIDKKAIFDAFCNEHRTIQQSMFSVLIFLLNGIASDFYGVDGRNIASHEVAIKFIAGYAEMEKQDFIKRNEQYIHNEADRTYYTNEGEKIRKAVIESPNLYIGVPMI